MLKKKTVVILALAAAFVLLLCAYLFILRPALQNAGKEEPRVLGSYLFDEIEKTKVLSVTVHPAGGTEYKVARRALQAPKVTDEDVTAEIARRVSAAGLSGATPEFMKQDAAEIGADLSAYSGETLTALYRAVIGAVLEQAAQYDATWCVEQDGTRYVWLTVDAWKLAELRTAARAVYLHNTVVTTNPEKQALKTVDEEKFLEYRRKYGLTGESFVEVADADGRVVRVLIGNKDTTGQGYFVMVDGGDTIGTTNTTTLGGYLETPSAALVECRIIPEMDNTYSYAYPVNFSLYHTARVYAGGAAAEGVTLREGDVVGLTYSLEMPDGNGGTIRREGQTLRDVPLTAGQEYLPEAALAALVGLPLGACDVPYDVTTQVGGETLTVTMRITSVDYVSATDEAFSLHYTGTDDILHPVNIYGFTSPEEMTAFLPSDSPVMEAMENVTGMEGTVVRLGLDDETKEEYGLWRHTVRVTIPYCKDPSGKGADKDISEGDYYYTVESVLYISAVQPDGSYYVGSPAYDLVAKVGSDAAGFVENTRFDWVEKSIFTTKVDDVEYLDFNWNYGGELDGQYHVEIRRGTRVKYGRSANRYLQPNGTVGYMAAVIVTCPDGSTVTLENEFDNARYEAAVAAYNRCVDENDPARAQVALDEMNAELAKEDRTAGFRDFTEQLLYLRYEGDLELSRDEIIALNTNPDAVALHVRIGLRDGSRQTIRFLPYSGARCMINFETTKSFYIFNSSLKTTAYNFLRVLHGEEIDTQGRY